MTNQSVTDELSIVGDTSEAKPSLSAADRQSSRLRVLEGLPADTLLIHEIYASIQGESTFAGLPCTFVRLTGCNLRCRWCDTPHSFTQGARWSRNQILEKVRVLSPRMVEITGGEPLVQDEVYPLMATLGDEGFTVLLETSGSVSIAKVDQRVTIILDLKCPSSGEEPANLYENLALLKPADEVKFVVGDRADFDWSVDKIREHRLTGHPLLIAPVFGEVEYATLCEWILETGLPLRFQPQLHKHVWHPNQRGV